MRKMQGRSFAHLVKIPLNTKGRGDSQKSEQSWQTFFSLAQTSTPTPFAACTACLQSAA
jgi:hypothetical protein